MKQRRAKSSARSKAFGQEGAIAVQGLLKNTSQPAQSMPRATIAWRDVWIGAAVIAFLFAIGKYLIGLYLGKVSVASGFGAAGSLVILLLWLESRSRKRARAKWCQIIQPA